MEDILQPMTDGSAPNIVVVQGVPGIGKSTFAWKFCRKWAKGKFYQDYSLVVMIYMRDSRVRSATKLSDLIFSEDEEFSSNVAKEIIHSEGEHVLFLLEGLDELPMSCLSEGRLLSNLLQGISLPAVTLVVTTRPWAEQIIVEKCGNQISRRIEILGFKKEDIVRYISNAFPDKERAEFREYLDSYPQLESIMHIPINAAFVIQIYKQFKGTKDFFPQTLTQLYTALVKGLLLRYVKSVPDFSKLKISNLENLPEPIKTHFEQLCLLAFMSFTKMSVQVTFTDTDLYECLDYLGLMQSFVDLSIDASSNIFHSFLHFTIQEFLAAYHLSHTESKVQELFIETNCDDPQFSMIIRFSIGLNSQMLHFLTGHLGDCISTENIHWLYESQSPADVCKYLGNGDMCYSSQLDTAFDLFALSYCICNSNCIWKLVINLNEITTVFYRQDSGLVLYSGYIKQLIIYKATQTGLPVFFSLPQSIFSKLTSLQLIDTDMRNTINLCEVIIHNLLPSLEQFTLHYQDNDQYLNIGDVIGSLQMSRTPLTYLSIKQAVITPLEVNQLCKFLSLTTIKLVGNCFIKDCLHQLVSDIANITSLTHFDLSHNKLSAPTLQALSNFLETNTSLKTLRLSQCFINDDGANTLATGLKQNSSLVEVALNWNDIGVDGAIGLSLMLKFNVTIKKLYLGGNEGIGTAGAIKLINALKCNTTLETLILSPKCKPVELRSISFRQIKQSNRLNFVYLHV